MSDLNEKMIKLETDTSYLQREISNLWTALTPVVRDNEELKTDLIRYLNRLDNIAKDVTLTEKAVGSIKDDIKKINEILMSYDENLKFVSSARKNINTIFVAIAIQTIFLICGLLAFVFVLTQRTTTSQRPFDYNLQPQQHYSLEQPSRTSSSPSPTSISPQQSQQNSGIVGGTR